MANFTVTPEALRAASRKLDTEAENYKQASDQAIASGRALAADWEGDAQKAFLAEQEKASAWYTKMAALARTYSAHLNTAAAEYEAADAQARSVIAKK